MNILKPKSVQSVCRSFTKELESVSKENLEVAKTAEQKRLKLIQKAAEQLEIATDARSEITASATAIDNVKKLFGVK